LVPGDEERAGGSEASVNDVQLLRSGKSGLGPGTAKGWVGVEVERVDFEAELFVFAFINIFGLFVLFFRGISWSTFLALSNISGSKRSQIIQSYERHFIFLPN
jgi:hypothetical protein